MNNIVKDFSLVNMVAELREVWWNACACVQPNGEKCGTCHRWLGPQAPSHRIWFQSISFFSFPPRPIPATGCTDAHVKDRPYGFVARPDKKADGTADMFSWSCLIPGKEGTDWASAFYPVKMIFTNEYPQKPPRVELPANFYHPNIYPSGKVCLSILNGDQAWKPSITIKQILVGVQELLMNPNENDPANGQANGDYVRNMPEYRRKVRAQARQYPSAEL